MDPGAILLLLVILLGVGLFLASPFKRGAFPRTMDASPEVSSLLADRDRIINALQELDFDFQLGKVPEDAYPKQRTSLLQQGAAILQKLDEVSPARPPARVGTMSAESASIEQTTAARAEGATDADGALSDDKIESMLAARRAARHARSAGFCPRCGKPVLTGDRFCPNCGKSLQ
jgi:NADH pyrophosphatase NudC (nudix superfamily)